jgi:uncharacterized protein YutE (UPF0331/DUF86 family)
MKKLANLAAGQYGRDMESALISPLKWPVETSPEDVLLIFKAIAETTSQRDSAIVAAAYLESKIKEIGARAAPGFVDVKKTSTGHCLELLQALGILDGQVRQALTRIFNIRNAFAHDPTCPELDGQKIAPDFTTLSNLMGKFSIPQDFGREFFENLTAQNPALAQFKVWNDPRWQFFRWATTLLYVHLVMVEANLPSRPEPMKFWGWSKSLAPNGSGDANPVAEQ